MDRYRDVLSQPGVKPLLFLAVIARMGNIPFGAVITAMAYLSTGSWIVAGLAGGGATASSALTSWIFGRLIDRFGARKVLLASAPGAAAILLIPITGEALAVVFLSVLAGALKPPSGTVIRSAWQERFNDNAARRSAVYGLDASLSPIAGSVGAALGAILLSVFGSWSVGALLVLILLVSSLGLCLHPSVAGISSSRKEQIRNAAPLSSPVRLALASGFASWAALGGIEIAVGGRWGPETMLWASSLSIMTVALGAFSFTNQASHRHSLSAVRTGLLASVLALLLLAAVLLLNPVLTVMAAATIGFGRGLIASAAVEVLAESAPEERMSEVMGLYGSGTLLGQAAYRPLAAGLIGIAPPLALLLPAGLCGFLALRLRSRFLL